MEEEKGLQKVTELEQIVDRETYDEYLKNNGPSKDLMDYIHDQMSKAYMEDDMDESVYHDILVENFNKTHQTQEKADNIRNLTYEVNQQMISACIHNYVRNNGCFPQVTAIKKKTGLSRTTIYRHLKLDDYAPADKLIKGKFEVMATMALEQLYKIGVEERNHAALKTFIEMVNGTNGVKQVNNYIQINNLKLTKEEFEQLPDEVIGEIENIISSTFITKKEKGK
ncbi:helix-turn-helix domain-containing protein [Flagellimonas sp. S174]|uniref:helix-turn-helix domain-containing protein n=1 Tax=Flagellimonas sp. S174 TaxID=3410790 RepID=UPI003BF5DCEF